MVAGTAGPFRLVEGADAAAEFDLAGRTCFQLPGIRVTVDNRNARMGATIRAGRVYFSLSHDTVLTPVMTTTAMSQGQKDSRRL